jgi:probable addiction module antidote protein
MQKTAKAESMTEILTDYDPAEDLDTPEAISVFVNEALKTDDATYIAHALGVVARTKGIAAIARRRGSPLRTIRHSRRRLR